MAIGQSLRNGRVEIDNHTAERALRRLALGRRDEISAGFNEGGERAVAMNSLVDADIRRAA